MRNLRKRSTSRPETTQTGRLPKRTTRALTSPNLRQRCRVCGVMQPAWVRGEG
jgi:hypothetical protein